MFINTEIVRGDGIERDGEIKERVWIVREGGGMVRNGGIVRGDRMMDSEMMIRDRGTVPY